MGGAEGERMLEKKSETRAGETDKRKDVKRKRVNRTKKGSSRDRKSEREGSKR